MVAPGFQRHYDTKLLVLEVQVRRVLQKPSAQVTQKTIGVPRSWRTGDMSVTMTGCGRTALQEFMWLCMMEVFYRR